MVTWKACGAISVAVLEWRNGGLVSVNEWKLTCETSAALTCNMITDFFVSKREGGYCETFVSFLQSFEEVAVAARL